LVIRLAGIIEGRLEIIHAERETGLGKEEMLESLEKCYEKAKEYIERRIKD